MSPVDPTILILLAIALMALVAVSVPALRHLPAMVRRDAALMLVATAVYSLLGTMVLLGLVTQSTVLFSQNLIIAMQPAIVAAMMRHVRPASDVVWVAAVSWSLGAVLTLLAGWPAAPWIGAFGGAVANAAAGTVLVAASRRTHGVSSGRESLTGIALLGLAIMIPASAAFTNVGFAPALPIMQASALVLVGAAAMAARPPRNLSRGWRADAVAAIQSRLRGRGSDDALRDAIQSVLGGSAAILDTDTAWRDPAGRPVLRGRPVGADGTWVPAPRAGGMRARLQIEVELGDRRRVIEWHPTSLFPDDDLGDLQAIVAMLEQEATRLVESHARDMRVASVSAAGAAAQRFGAAARRAWYDGGRPEAQAALRDMQQELERASVELAPASKPPIRHGFMLPRTVAMDGVVQRAVQGLTPGAKARGVVLITQTVPTNATIDPVVARQLIDALLGHAIARTPSGDPVHISCLPEERVAVLRIQDAGHAPDDGIGASGTSSLWRHCRRLARTCGGSMEVSCGGAGAVTELRLPFIDNSLQGNSAQPPS